MKSLKNKIKFFRQKAKLLWLFFGFFRKTKITQEDLDRKLVYDLSSRKIPNSQQVKHLKKFLSRREFLIVKICLLIIIVNLVYLGFVFVNKHLQAFPISGGKYSEGVVGYPQTINPIYDTSSNVDSDISHLIYSSLFVYNKDGLLSNDLVENVKANASSTEYIIQIRKNVKWHNKQNLTVDDVIFTFNLIKNPEYNSPLRDSLNGIRIEKLDNYTVKFILVKPYSPFLDLLTFGILPKNLWENIGPKRILLSPLNLKPVGSGPFKFKSLIKNSNGDLEDYYLEVNNDYYKKIPYLKTFDFKFFASYQEAIKALNDNKIIGLSRLPFALRDDVLAQDSLNFHHLLQPKIVALFFNYDKNKALSDKLVRISLAQALNKKEIIDNIFSGIYKESNGPLSPKSLAYNKDLTVYKYLPESSIKFFKEKPLTVSLTVVDSGNHLMVAQKIVDYWKKVGVIVKLRIVSKEEISKIIKNRDFEILLYGEFIGGDPDLYAFWDSSQKGSQGLNLSNYSNSQVDKLLESARTTNNIKSRIAKYKEVQKIISTDLPAIFLYSPVYTYVQEMRLKGFSGTMSIEPANRFNSVSSWYLNTKKKFVK